VIETHRAKETLSQRDREQKRQIAKETESKRDREPNRQRAKETQRAKQTESKRDRGTHRLVKERRINGHTDGQFGGT
jgi:hypothetical protein